MTIKNFKATMTAKAEKRGEIWENFGQNELSKIKDKYFYSDLLKSDLCLTKKEIDTRNLIDELNRWAMTFNL